MIASVFRYLLVALLIVTSVTTRAASPAPDPQSSDPAARGAYLALAGNCAGCHTTRGGAPYAGGRPITTPFGTIHAGNLTPDTATGLGAWSADDFWRAMHDGRSRDGRALYPAFPYPDYTRLTRRDADALFAFLRALPAVSAPNRPHALRFPWNLPWLLEGWRWLYFRAAEFRADPGRDAGWNRGAYLVEVLGHCGACHTARDRFGGPRGPALGGAELPGLGWHAPSLRDDREGGVARWTQAEVVGWLASGTTARAVSTGPMARIVADSLQHLTEADRVAMARYLQALPGPAAGAADTRRRTSAPVAAVRGERVYRDHCEDCHGAEGRGAPPHWPALAGNRTVTAASPTNLIRTVLHGGFLPATRTHPRPYGMPPFGPVLDDREVADVASWLRASWGHAASAVDPREVNPLRPVPAE